MGAEQGTAPRRGWHWAYAVFKFGDGLTHALFPLTVLLVYDRPLWAVAAVTAAMNLAGVPSAFVWARFMERGRGRRRMAVLGFAVSSAALALVALRPPFWGFVALTVLFVAFGTATAPAASILALEGVPKAGWARATGALSRRTGYGFLLGVSTTVALGLAGWLSFPVLFVAGAAFTALAALIAHLTISPYDPILHPPKGFDKDTAREGQRRFERAVWFPARLFFRPTRNSLRLGFRREPAPLLFAVGALFFATVVFFSSYPGVLSEDLRLGAGLVLLGQAPASFLTPMTYKTAGRYGDRHGMARGMAVGVTLRMVALTGFCATILGLGRAGFPLLLVFHAMLGISFAFIQVNAPLLAAVLHPGGRGQGVGAYHATIGLGTLMGSVTSAVILVLAPLYVTYVVAVAAVVAGAVLAFTQLRRHAGLRLEE